ncbi:unnamed protein product [Auanema sp. JU1783]|nr:unnamed protein product [Auanema sp. JU1783]
MDESDCIVLDSKESSPMPAPAVYGIPTSFKDDNLCQFSFSDSTRRSLSQPITFNEFYMKDDDKEDDVLEALSTSAQALVSPVKKRCKKQPSILDEFFGVYCLISRSQLKHYKNRCYIGYTVDPNRRINQHNGGREKGGAKKTDSKGPWDMVCIIHGFPNSVAALRFEWAWQNPEKSKAIKDLNLKKNKKETPFAFRLRIACHLLNSFPWCRYALTFRWLLVSEELPFPSDVPIPSHVRTAYGLVEKTSTLIPQESRQYVNRGSCSLCKKSIERLIHILRCTDCKACFHSKCLAEYNLKDEKKSQLFPLHCECPKCFAKFFWGDIIRDQHHMLKIDEAKSEDLEKGSVPLTLAPAN